MAEHLLQKPVGVEFFSLETAESIPMIQGETPIALLPTRLRSLTTQ